MTMRYVVAAGALLILSGCATGASDTGVEGGLAELRSAISDRVECGELFEIRNAAEQELRDAGQMETANEALREIGCSSSGSSRSD